MFKTLSIRLALAAGATLVSTGAMAAAIDEFKATNGLTGIYSSSFGGGLPPCGGSSPPYCSFFGGFPSAGQIAVVGVSPNPTGVTTATPLGITGAGPGSFLNLTSDGVNSTLTGGTITFGNATLTIPSQGVTATIANAGMVLDPAAQVAAVNGNGHSEFLVNLQPSVASDFSLFSAVTTSCTGPGAPGGVCGLITTNALNLDMVRYRLFVQWDPTFTQFTSTFIGQTANNSMVFANLDTVPVPAAVWLMGSAVGLLGWIRRKALRS